MIPENLRKAEAEFRRSIERRDYRDLTSLSADIRVMTTEHLASLPANDPARRELIAWGLALTEWGRKMVCTQRQRWANQKQPLDMVVRYLPRSASSATSFCIDL